MSDSLRPRESQHTRPPCPSPTPGVHSDSRPLSPWCHPAISSSVIPFSSCPQSLPASESFPMSQLFSWGGQSTGVSALTSFLPKKSQGWSPEGVPISKSYWGLGLQHTNFEEHKHSAHHMYHSNNRLRCLSFSSIPYILHLCNPFPPFSTKLSILIIQYNS